MGKIFKGITTAVGGMLMGTYPPNNLDAPGPHGYISARFTNYLAENWTQAVGSQVIQNNVQASPAYFQFYANPVRQNNVKVVKLPPGQFTLNKGYLAHPNPGK
jgi:hypothetical protein